MRSLNPLFLAKISTTCLETIGRIPKTADTWGQYPEINCTAQSGYDGFHTMTGYAGIDFRSPSNSHTA